LLFRFLPGFKLQPDIASGLDFRATIIIVSRGFVVGLLTMAQKRDDFSAWKHF
jgi:hypothetical protein